MNSPWRQFHDSLLAAGDGVLVVDKPGSIDPQVSPAEISATAVALPGSGELILLCEDRRRFLVAFAAALLHRRTVLLPSSPTTASLVEIGERYPASAVVDDNLEVTIGACASPTAGPVGNDFIAIIAHTSGSSGAPSAHAKTFRSLAATTTLNAVVLRAELARRAGTGRPWIVATVPPQHMYGLETSVLLPLLAGFGLHAGTPLLPADVATALAEVPEPRILVSTPFHLRTLVESAAGFPAIAVVVSATAPLDRALAVRIEKRFGAALVEVFGSTETCAIATRHTAHEDGWRPHPGVELAATDGGTRVRAPWFTEDQLLHDVVRPRRDGTFTVVGRGTDVIEVAGKRASLADLTRRLASIEGVEDAVVFQPPVGDGGKAARCAALVVAPRLSAREVARRMRGLVDAVFVPRPIVLVNSLPRNALGKLPRKCLLEAVATSSASRPRRGT